MLYLFDLDGTLMLSDRSGGRAFERACQELLGIERALARVTLHGNTDPSILEEAMQHTLGRAPTAAEEAAVLDRYVQLLAEELARPNVVRVLPGVTVLLDQLEERGALVGLATGNIERGARLKLEAASLWHRFRFGGYGSDHRERAELVRVAIERASALHGRAIDPREATVLGDTPRDVAAARAVGARAVAVATGMHTVEELLATGADEVHATLESFTG